MNANTHTHTHVYNTQHAVMKYADNLLKGFAMAGVAVLEYE